jgi:hypothetical protein
VTPWFGIVPGLAVLESSHPALVIAAALFAAALVGSLWVLGVFSDPKRSRFGNGRSGKERQP